MVNARRLLFFLLPWSAGLAWPAFAADNVLYRCTDASGNPAFTNSQQGYRSCAEIGRYPQKQNVPAVASASVQAMTPSAAVPPPAAAAGGLTTGTPAPAKKLQRGAVYRFEREGVIHYTNVKPANGRAELVFTYAIDTCIACNIRSTVDWHSVALKLEDYDAEIAAAAVAHGVDEALVRAIIHAESAYRANARSHKGAQGLMQLMPATAQRFGVTDAYDPAQNIAGGVQYLAFLLNLFGGDVRLAAAGYNAGEGAVSRHGGVPPYAETQVYVDRVGILHARYRAALDGTLDAAAAAAATTGASL